MMESQNLSMGIKNKW